MMKPRARSAGQLQEYVAVLAGQLLSTAPLDAIFKSGVFLQSDFDETTESYICDRLGASLELAGAKVVGLHATRLTDGLGLKTLSNEVSTQIDGQVRNESPRLLMDAVRQATADGATLAVIIKGIETLGCNREGARVLHALKSCRDSVNLPPDSRGRLLIIGIGRSQELAVLTGDSTQAFYGATLLAIPELSGQ